MKRWLIDGVKQYYPSAEEAMAHWPQARDIREIEDDSCERFVESILEKSTLMAEGSRDNDHRILLHYNSPMGLCEVLLFQDNADGAYYDYARYRLHRSGRVIVPTLWDVATPEAVFRKFYIPNPAYSVLAMGSKVAKPKVLRGKKQIAAARFCRSSCQLFVHGHDLYIKHTDYFSPTVRSDDTIGTPLAYRTAKYGMRPKSENFVYNDNWGAIVVRQCAWCRFANIIPVVQNLTAVECADKMCELMKKFHNFDQLEREWYRFFETVSKEVRAVI